MGRHKMATELTEHRRVELERKTIALTVLELQEIAEDWDEIGDGERDGWALDWSNEMSGLQWLSRLAAAGRLTKHQKARYVQLVREVGEALPAIKRLGLYQPVLEQHAPRSG
jgi:hypothetical protein